MMGANIMRDEYGC